MTYSWEIRDAWGIGSPLPGLFGFWLLTGGSPELTPGYCLAPLPGLVPVMLMTSALELRRESRRDTRK
jgi:hypothetical protein